MILEEARRAIRREQDSHVVTKAVGDPALYVGDDVQAHHLGPAGENMALCRPEPNSPTISLAEAKP
jgi:hypothetical protein